MSVKLGVSIVTHHPDISLLRKTMVSLSIAAASLTDGELQLVLVDNDEVSGADVLREIVGSVGITAQILSGHGNVGYGCGHNLALKIGNPEFHLILNPDVELAPNALSRALEFMVANPACGLLTPRAFDEFGQRQYLCKRYPTILDLLLRGFAPRFIYPLFQRRLAKYEVREETSDSVYWDPPVVSGCFMLFRTSVLKRVGGFDPRYFLYFEDFDLSLRAGRISRIAYDPAVRIVHHGGNAARKGWRHIAMFTRSVVTFFNTHGWRWW